MGCDTNTTIRWDISDGVLLVVHAPAAPDRHEWSAFVQECTATKGVGRALVVAPDAALDAVQRKEIGELVKVMGVSKVAVVTSSKTTQAIVTGLGWLTGVHRGFSPNQIEETTKFLGLGEARARELLARAQEMAAKLGNSSLAKRRAVG